MAMYNVNMTSFEEVEKRYASIKPLGGRDNKGKDIRPIADRARKWESIRKISDSCYVLDDGDCFHDSWGRYTDKEKVQLAAIVWRRHKDGTETVTIRNGSGNFGHARRYSFLERFIPIGLRFECTYGKQFITNASSTTGINQRIFLAKSNWYGKYLGDNRNLYGKRAQRDDGVALVFRRKSRPVNVLGWEFESGGKEIPRPPRTQIIKSLKAKHKKDLEELWTWMMAIQAVIEKEDYSYKWELERAYDKAAGEIGYDQGYLAKFSRAVLSDTKHPMRLNLAHKFLSKTKEHPNPDTWRSISIFEEATPQNVRARFNSWANTQFGFTKKVK